MGTSASPAVRLRIAVKRDARQAQNLLEALGYPVPLDEIARRLSEPGERRLVLVATHSNRLVGLTSAVADDHFVEGVRGYVEGLIVDESLRSQGIGERLLHAAEEWLRSRGCKNVFVHSNVIRNRAHAFYERLGYERVKAQYYFRRALSAADSRVD